MWKLQNLEIEFDRTVAVYIPGETVTGKVTVDLPFPITVGEIKLKIRGKAKIYYSVKEKGRDSGHDCGHSGNKEYYFNDTNQLVASTRGEEPITLPAGPHSYPFSFELPVRIPGSFEHKHGYVRYTVKVIVYRPRRLEYKIVSKFIVLAPYGLRTQRKFARPLHDEIEHQFLSGCLDAGEMTINITSPKRGFAPGDTIELRTNYDRSFTGVDIRLIRLQLVKLVIFYADRDECKKEVLAEVYQGGCFRTMDEFVMKLVVPSVPPSNMKDCSIIDVQYRLVVTVHVSGMHHRITRSYPVQLWDSLLAR